MSVSASNLSKILRLHSTRPERCRGIILALRNLCATDHGDPVSYTHTLAVEQILSETAGSNLNDETKATIWFESRRVFFFDPRKVGSKEVGITHRAKRYSFVADSIQANTKVLDRSIRSSFVLFFRLPGETMTCETDWDCHPQSVCTEQWSGRFLHGRDRIVLEENVWHWSCYVEALTWIQRSSSGAVSRWFVDRRQRLATKKSFDHHCSRKSIIASNAPTCPFSLLRTPSVEVSHDFLFRQVLYTTVRVGSLPFDQRMNRSQVQDQTDPVLVQIEWISMSSFDVPA